MTYIINSDSSKPVKERIDLGRTAKMLRKLFKEGEVVSAKSESELPGR